VASQSTPVNDFTGAVLAWGAPRLRDLPWRRTRDPWAVLVSEVMLQQTQVARVIPRWEAFLERFPTPAACAAAPLGDVLREWQGLGYPRRARNLHATAQQVTELGGFPRDLAGLLALPGIGQYTARAVMAFAFELDAAVVDTNIARVYARVAGERLTPKRVQAMADAACPSGDAWAWNQCLMDLGAVLCRPANPSCDECPVRAMCAWAGGDEPDPAVGSSGVSGKQARFEGSDRQARGRLMKALSDGPVDRAQVPVIMERDASVAARLVDDLVADGLCCRAGSTLTLP
jgi:A/G-specific adenine glycosylase